MPCFLLIRHGETAWNVERVFRGQADVPLSARGEAQANRLAEAYAETPIAAVYSSPLQRALGTAKAFAKPHGLQVETAAALTSIAFGEWQGERHETVRARWPERYERWHREPHLVQIAGAETLSAVRERALNTVETLTAKYPSPDTLLALITHRVVCKLLTLGILGLGPDRFWQLTLETTGVSIFETTNRPHRYRLLSFNSTAHLASPSATSTVSTRVEDF